MKKFKSILKVVWILLGVVFVLWQDIVVWFAIVAMVVFAYDPNFTKVLLTFVPGWSYALISLWPAVRGFKDARMFVGWLWFNIVFLIAPPTLISLIAVIAEVPNWIR